jgi:hypothetical protein
LRKQGAQNYHYIDKYIHPDNKATTKVALASWTEYHESPLKIEPWKEKLKKQIKATVWFVKNP